MRNKQVEYHSIHLTIIVSQQDSDALGYINVDEMLSVSRCDDEGVRDPRYKHCFEVNTQGRGYLLCADTEEDMKDWIYIFEQTIPHDAADNLVNDFFLVLFAEQGL